VEKVRRGKGRKGKERRAQDTGDTTILTKSCQRVAIAAHKHGTPTRSSGPFSPFPLNFPTFSTFPPTSSVFPAVSYSFGPSHHICFVAISRVWLYFAVATRCFALYCLSCIIVGLIIGFWITSHRGARQPADLRGPMDQSWVHRFPDDELGS